MTDRATLDLWFEFGSTYSYLSVMRAEAVAARHGLRIRYQPFLLGPIFKAFGWSTSPFNLQKQKGEYMWRDVERQCARYGLPWRKPSVFPRLTILPMRVATLGASEPWIGDYCRAVMHEAFALDRDISSEPAVREVLERLALPASTILDAAQSEPNKLRLRAQTERAAALGIFGAPTFIADGEMFWGDDRLENAIEWLVHRAG